MCENILTTIRISAPPLFSFCPTGGLSLSTVTAPYRKQADNGYNTVCARSPHSPPVSLVLQGRACTSISWSKKGWQKHVLLLSQVFALAQLWLFEYLWPYHVGGQPRRFNSWCAIPTPLAMMLSCRLQDTLWSLHVTKFAQYVQRWSTDPRPHVCFHAQTPSCWVCFSNKQTKKDQCWQEFSW